MILLDQLKHIWIDAELEVIDTAIYTTALVKRTSAGLNLTGGRRR